MRTINTDLIEKLLLVNNKILKFADKYIFVDTSLTPTQFNILGEIILHDGQTINELKQNLIISSPALSQLLNRMESSLLIERFIWKSDKREVTISPTKKWKDLYKKLNVKYIKMADDKLSKISDKDKKIVLATLEFMEKNILTIN